MSWLLHRHLLLLLWRVVDRRLLLQLLLLMLWRIGSIGLLLLLSGLCSLFSLPSCVQKSVTCSVLGLRLFSNLMRCVEKRLSRRVFDIRHI